MLSTGAKSCYMRVCSVNRTCVQQLQLKQNTEAFYHKRRQLHILGILISRLDTNRTTQEISNSKLVVPENVQVKYIREDISRLKLNRHGHNAFVRNSHTNSTVDRVTSDLNGNKSLMESSERLDVDSDSNDDEDSDSDTEDESDVKLDSLNLDYNIMNRSKKFQRGRFFQRYSREDVKKVAETFLESESIIRRTAAENGLEGILCVLLFKYLRIPRSELECRYFPILTE